MGDSAVDNVVLFELLVVGDDDFGETTAEDWFADCEGGLRIMVGFC